MFSSLLRIYARTKMGYSIYPFFVFSPILFLNIDFIFLWISISLLFMGQTFTSFFRDKKTISLLLFFSHYPVKHFLMFSNLILFGFSAIGVILLLLIPIFLNKMGVILALYAFLCFCQLFFLCCIIGNRISVSSSALKKSFTIRTFFFNLLFSIIILSAVLLIPFVMLLSLPFSILVLIIFLILLIICWYLSLPSVFNFNFCYDKY